MSNSPIYAFFILVFNESMGSFVQGRIKAQPGNAAIKAKNLIQMSLAHFMC
jgi:hypothetical protein